MTARTTKTTHRRSGKTREYHLVLSPSFSAACGARSAECTAEVDLTRTLFDFARTACRNTKAPMPELVISSTSATSATAPVPVQALQPSLRILKRPSAPTSPSPSATPAAEAQQNSLAEREADYRAARERIFGGTANVAGSSSSSSSAPSAPSAEARGAAASPPLASAPDPPPQAAVKPIRSPRGPDPGRGDPSARGGAGASRGFRGRGSNVRNTSSRGRTT